MKFSMNGFRCSFHGNAHRLRDVVSSVVDGGCYDNEELIEAVNDIIRDSNVINCVYQKDDPDFVEMADLEVKFLEA